MTAFGSFAPLCTNVPSYPWCNLFYRQLLDHAPASLVNLSAHPASAPVGINPICGIPLVDHNGSLGNIANTVVAGVSILVVLYFILRVSARKAAVGRVEFRILLATYILSLVLQILTTGSYLEQGSSALTALTAIHAGVVATLFWFLIANSLIATQFVEDGTVSALVPFFLIGAAFFIATTYISLDTGFSFTSRFGPSVPPTALNSIPVFVLTSIWPGVAALFYFLFMIYIVFVILQELRPLLYYVLAAVLFVLSQLDWFLLSQVICSRTSAKIDGSFIATILETATVGVLYMAWLSITEEDWSDDVYYGN